jgi:phytol kinase
MSYVPWWVSAVLILALMIGLMAGVKALQDRKSLHPELARKLIHIGMGLVTLSFPWLFQNAWQVGLIAAMASALMLSVRRLPQAKSHFGNVLHAIERTSFGEFFFPISVVLLFILSRGQPLLFCIPMLILTFGDATAALIGVRYGLNRYNAEDGAKSLEGSLAFFAVVYFCVHIPLLLFTSISQIHCVLIAITLGLLATLLEAFAWNGLDNLFLPIGAFVMLEKLQLLSAPELAERIIIILVLVAFMAILGKRTTLRHSALLGAAFGCYVAWTIGGLIWLIAPLTVLIAYPLLTPRSNEAESRSHKMHSVLSISSVGFCWISIAFLYHQPSVYYCYVLSYAIQLSLIGIVRRSHDSGKNPQELPTIAVSVVKSWAVLFVPYIWLSPSLRTYFLESGAGFIIMAIITVLFYSNNRITVQRPTNHEILWQQALFTAAGSILGILFVAH